ncbi:MAG: murein biosynthesis integral membrane protein MurJ, partial [Chitinophagaceae bacterium]|nr:murein biosynthesis integral membrane protein MurJ [Anaerolineae bacterium]
MNITPSAALSNRQVIRAALVVLLGFVASGILGVIRTAVFSATFGTSSQLDAFYAAQRIPEML